MATTNLFYVSQFSKEDGSGELLKQESIEGVHAERHFQLAKRRYRSGMLKMGAPEVLTPLEKGMDLRIPQPVPQSYSIEVNGSFIALQDTDLKPRDLGEVVPTDDVIASWYEKVGAPYVTQPSVLRMADDVQSEIVQGKRFLQYDQGFFITYDIEYYNLSRLCTEARVFIAGALCVSSGPGYLDFQKKGETVRFTDFFVENRGPYVTYLAVAHFADPISKVVQRPSFFVEKKVKEDAILLTHFEIPPEKICMLDLEGLQVAGDCLPWCAGVVLMNKWVLEKAEMIYFAEAVTGAFENGKTVGKWILTYNEFRAHIESYALQGYILVVKGVVFEFKFLNDLFYSKITPSQCRIGIDTYRVPAPETPWRFILHDLQCLPFNDLYPYYKDHMRIRADCMFVEDYIHMGHGSKGHVPAIECIFFLHHWRQTFEYLLYVARAVTWNPVYLQKRSIKEILCREMDLSYMTSYWDHRLKQVPPPMEMAPVCYKGPYIEHAMTRMSVRLGYSISQALTMKEVEWEFDPCGREFVEEYKQVYGEYFVSTTPLRVLAKLLGLKPGPTVDRLIGYGWRLCDIIAYPADTQPNWADSFRLFTSLIALRGPLCRERWIDWQKIVAGDFCELYALVADTKTRNTYLKDVTDPVIVEHSRAYARTDLLPKSADIFNGAIMSAQRLPKLMMIQVGTSTWTVALLYKGKTVRFDPPEFVYGP